MTLPKTFRVRAHAKINLLLRVGAVQADGYHPLHTVFQSLALHDTLEFRPRRGRFELTCTDPGVPCDDRNLVARAARALWADLGRPGHPHGVAIHLAKHIPMQAGLGGGSADAAAALTGLWRCWRPGKAMPDLAGIASRLGADVPYFLVGGTALGLGRGDEVYPLEDLSSHAVVLALPDFGVATADAYRWFDDDRAAGAPCHGARRRDGGSVQAWPGVARIALANDLEAPVARRHPRIAAIRDVLAGAGAEGAAMTGSGSAVFGLFGAESRARRAARAVAEAGDVAILTRTVDRRTCHRVHFSFASSSPRHA
jgi:4-diphosphocytidyl-2-C-methyl-D-erythritol kinase